MTDELTTFGLVIIFGLVMVPVYLMLAGWLFGKPRQLRPILQGFGYLIIYTVVILAGLGVMGTAVRFIVPY